jgi:hypothetical protein
VTPVRLPTMLVRVAVADLWRRQRCALIATSEVNRSDERECENGEPSPASSLEERGEG